MHFVLSDFNNATNYYAGAGAQEWRDLEEIIRQLPIFFQASQQAGLGGSPIFDPKATNAFLASQASTRGWHVIPVPHDLTEFGTEWDGGKGGTLAEWQFSNYPFLWNNVIRSEAVYKSKTQLAGLQSVKALVVVTKSGIFPSSNSTLYFEQARAQLEAVTKFGAFTIPIRLVGLTLPAGTAVTDVVWSEYPGRYSRAAAQQVTRRMAVTWRQAGKYGVIADFEKT
jgi:hypothetical protein